MAAQAVGPVVRLVISGASTFSTTLSASFLSVALAK